MTILHFILVFPLFLPFRRGAPDTDFAGYPAKYIWISGQIYLDIWPNISGYPAKYIWISGQIYLDFRPNISGYPTKYIWISGEIYLDIRPNMYMTFVVVHIQLIIYCIVKWSEKKCLSNADKSPNLTDIRSTGYPNVRMPGLWRNPILDAFNSFFDFYRYVTLFT